MKRRTKQLIKRIGSGSLAVMLSVALNINPLATLCEVVADSGLIDKFGNLKDNLIYMAEGRNIDEVLASDEMTPDTTNIDEVMSTIREVTKSNPALDTPFPQTSEELLNAILDQMEQSNETSYSDVLEEIRDNTDEIETNTYSTSMNLRSGFRATVNALMGNSNSIHADIKALHGMVEQHFGIVEQQLAHISEQLDMINENIDSMQHNYRVAHLYSLNAEFDNALYRPYTAECPYVEDFAQVIGQFANVYTGYWDTAITEMNRPGNSAAERALEVLGYDAIVRYEGVVLKNETLQQTQIENQTRDLRVAILGDSISTFAGMCHEFDTTYPYAGVESDSDTWWQMAIDEMGFTFGSNASQSGATVNPFEGDVSQITSYSDIRINSLDGEDGSDPDIIIVYLGTNDIHAFTEEYPIREADKESHSSTFEGNLGKTISKINTTYPNAYVFLCTLPPQCEADSNELFKDPNEYTYIEYNEAIRDVAVQYQCPIVELQEVWSPDENMEFTEDGIHPNADGMKKISKQVVTSMKSANLLGKSSDGAGKIKVMNAPEGQTGLHEAYDMAGNVEPTSLAVLYQEFIPEQDITWLDAVTVLYKALKQHLYTYQTFSTPNTRITPETSPAYAGFSNIVPDDNGFYNGYDFYMYLNRSNVVNGTVENYNMEAVYWQKALNEQFVTRKTDMNSPITASEFYILATKMMQAYGEPVINQDEIKALLQVYGTDYPVTLGFEVADAWAYLKVRGCLNKNIVPSGYLTRDELLDICMCIADPDSRSDYKNINVVLDLSDVLRDNGYYPAYDLNFSVGAFTATDEIDYTQMDQYTYLIAKQDKFKLGETGMLRVYESPDVNGKELKNAAASASTLKVGEDEFYVVHLPNGNDGSEVKTAYIAMVNAVTNTVVPGDVSWFEIPASAQIGGLFLGGYTLDGGNEIAVVNTEGTAWKPFDYRAADKDLIRFNDAIRSGKEVSGYVASNASNATLKEKIAYDLDKWFSPMIVEAAEPSLTLSNSTTIKFADIGSGSKNGTQLLQSSVAGSLTNSYSVESIKTVDLDSYEDKIKEINVAGNGETLMLNRLWWLCNTNGASNVYPVGQTVNHTMYHFAEGYYNGKILPGTAGVLAQYDYGINLKSTLESNNSMSATLADNRANRVTINYPSNMALLAYSLGMMPIPHLLEVEKGSPPLTITIKTSDGTNSLLARFNCLGSNNKNDIASDVLKLLSSTEGIEEKVRVARSEYNTKVSAVDGGYYITCNDSQAVADLIGSCAVSDVSTLTQTVASTAVMNRENQLMLSWSDMLKSGVVYSTKDGGQPKKHNDGAYYFMTRYGQVMVNDEKHTIQVGTVLYDLSYSQSNGESPKLVYIDNEQAGEMYFDVRCVMGMITTTYTRNNTKTIALRKTLGQGEYTNYEISNDGWGADGVSIKHVLCFNFPEVNENDFSQNMPSDGSYVVDILRSTSLDGIEYSDTDGSSFIYWDGSVNATRYLMSSFAPTANWLTVIDDDGAEFKASLFVYYPKIVFEGKDGEVGGFVDDPSSNTVIRPSPPDDADERWKDLSVKLSEAAGLKNSSGQNVEKMILNLYDVASVDDAEWYIKMSIDAIVDLYLLTGKYYVSPDYVVREFVITDNSCTQVEAWKDYDCTEKEIYPESAQQHGLERNFYKESGNAVGAIYWLEGVGFVYNMPYVGEDDDCFTLQKYFDGEYALPLACDNTGKYKTNSGIINYNMNYYGMGVKKGNIIGDEIPYGYVLCDDGYVHYTHSDREQKILDGYSYEDLPHEGDEVNGMLTLPFTTGENGLVLAPGGIYFSFGGNATVSTKVKSINDYNTKVNRFYYGNGRITLNKVMSKTSSSTFNFVSTAYNPINILSEQEFYKVWQGVGTEAFIARNSFLEPAASDDVNRVTSEDWLPNGLTDWFAELGSNDLITAIDMCSSMLILFAFYVLPIVGIIIMTILVGLSFLGDNKVVQWIVSKTFDPIRILTIGHRNIHTWKWNKVLVPCILLYVSFALFLRGNIIRIIMYLANWYDSVMQWARAVF